MFFGYLLLVKKFLENAEELHFIVLRRRKLGKSPVTTHTTHPAYHGVPNDLTVCQELSLAIKNSLLVNTNYFYVTPQI